MNILASYNWMKDFADINLSPEEFAKELSLKSSSVEHIMKLKDRFRNIVIGMVKELKPHPNADRLQIAMTDVGDDIVQIVCGGENLREGMRVIVALPGSRVRWHGEGDLVEMQEAKVRGEKSFGMIVAPTEIGFEKVECAERDIWDVSELTQAEPGMQLVDAFDIDDTIFDIEVTSNRVDCMSMIGLARDAAASIGAEFTFKPSQLPQGGSGKELKVTVKDHELCPRYMAVVMDGVKVCPSPLWLQIRLLLSGHRPINNIVDITNYILHEYGQPLHAFDYDKLSGKEIVVRQARAGEDFEALDGSKHELTEKNLVIADAMDPVAVAGVMGGMHSSTTGESQTIVLEAAMFDPISVRKTARELNLYSDSQLLFEKGISVMSPEFALAKAIELVRELAGGEVASSIFDSMEGDYSPLHFPLDPKKVVGLIGVHVDTDKMIEMLEDLGFGVNMHNSGYDVTVPHWRDHDIEHEVDLIEEIARIFGYHNIPSVLPLSPPPMTLGDKVLVWEDWTRHHLKSTGFTEFFGYSFISAELFEKYDLDAGMALSLHNPLSSELTHMRTSLMPSLLSSIESNQGETPHAKVFELSRIYPTVKDDLPNERTELVVAEYGKLDIEDRFLEMKGVLEDIAEKTGLQFTFVREEDDSHWHKGRSARVMLGGRKVGVLGQVEEDYTRAFKVDGDVIAMQLDWETIMKSMRGEKRYSPLPDFPGLHRDIAIDIDEKIEFEKVDAIVRDQSALITEVQLKDVYRGKGIAQNRKSLTLALTLQSNERTLTSSEADKVMQDLEDVLKREFGAIIR